jgi:hypothetical protein
MTCWPQIPQDLHITFHPDVLLEVTLPQAEGPPVPVTAGVQLPRNRVSTCDMQIYNGNVLIC